VKRSILLLVAAAGCASPSKPVEPPQLPKVTVHLIQAHSRVQATHVPATVEVVEHATVSSRVPARVKRVHVKEGELVHEGAVLLSLADDDIRSQLAGARASLSSVEAQVRRLTALSGAGAATQSELEAAVAQRAQAQAAVGGLEEALHYTDLRAPFTGRVQSKQASQGDLVMPGVPLLELEGQGLEVVAALSSEELVRVSVGQSLAFEASGSHGRAEVTSIAPSADPVAHRVKVRARVLEGATVLRAGSFARLDLPAPAGAEGEVWVPASALVQRGDLRGVFVAGAGEAELRWLLLGDALDGALPVRAGLRAEEQLIDAPGSLRDGQPIEVARAN
jgi:RND family efflux transporter MFP subunit